jgi:hypothetical protein
MSKSVYDSPGIKAVEHANLPTSTIRSGWREERGERQGQPGEDIKYETANASWVVTVVSKLGQRLSASACDRV